METDLKIAYIIAAHKNPKQVARLIAKLSCDHTTFFLHIDKKVSLQKFKEAIPQNLNIKVNFLKQFSAKWSEYGIVKAELEALKTIMESEIKYDFIILLSGQDYPIKSNSYIREFLIKHKNKSFIESFSMPFEPWPNGGMDRINRYHFKILGKSFAHPPYKNPESIIDKIAAKIFQIIFAERKLPYGFKPFGGEHWWNFNYKTAKYILKFLDENPAYFNFHKYSFCADELFFQTLLMNSNNKEICENIVNDDLRYYDWSEGKDSPKTFTILDLDKLMKSEKLFARKFDINIDKQVLEEIDKVF